MNLSVNKTEAKARRIVLIQGHPDNRSKHFGHALANAYAKGAQDGGHDVKTIDVAWLDFPLIKTKEDWETKYPLECIKQAQNTINWADHMVIFYPLWLGTMPAILKAFFEQVLRPGFAIEKTVNGRSWKKKLTGKSGRVVITMGMPAFIYRWYYRAHSLKSLERNILEFCGIKPIKESLVGTVESSHPKKHEKWLNKMWHLGNNAF